MTIRLNQTDFAQASAFQSSYWVHTEGVGNRHLFTLTGIVIVDFSGTGSDWRRDRLELSLEFPAVLPPGQYFRVEHWAPFVTLNAVANERQAVNAGWAVDDFGGPGHVTVRHSIDLWADLAVREMQGHLMRVGYSLTVSGTFVEVAPIPP